MSKRAKPTPGPWRVRKSRVENTRLEIESANGDWIADARLCTATGRGIKEQAANARLLAAAPEMYEALRGLVADYELLLGDGLTTENAPAPLQKARAAIAMAARQS